MIKYLLLLSLLSSGYVAADTPPARYVDTFQTGTVTAQDTASTTTTQYNNQVIYTGTPTSGSAATFTVSSQETAMVTVTGTWTGTLQIEVSTNSGTSWSAHTAHQLGSSNFISSFTSNFIGSLNLAAKNWIRVRGIAAWTGTANVQITASSNASNVYVANSIKLIDGSSNTSTTTLTIKPASTAPATTDTAAVVTLSPNGNQALAANQTTEITALTSIQSTSNSTAVNTAAIQSNQTNGSQRTLITNLVGDLLPSGDAPARTIYVTPNDGTNSIKVVAGSAQAAYADTAIETTERPDNLGTVTQTSVSCGTSSTTLLAGSTATQFIWIRNPTTATTTVFYTFNGTSATTAAPSMDLPPGAEVSFFSYGTSFLPTSQFNCIVSGTASTVDLAYK